MGRRAPALTFGWCDRERRHIVWGDGGGGVFFEIFRWAFIGLGWISRHLPQKDLLALFDPDQKKNNGSKPRSPADTMAFLARDTVNSSLGLLPIRNGNAAVPFCSVRACHDNLVGDNLHILRNSYCCMFIRDLSNINHKLAFSD